MVNRHRSRICVYPVSPDAEHYVAVFPSDLLGATFSVIFSTTITGAVALHTFAEMIRKQYGHAVEITVPEGVSLPRNSPVKDLLSKLNNPMILTGNS